MLFVIFLSIVSIALGISDGILANMGKIDRYLPR